MCVAVFLGDVVALKLGAGNAFLTAIREMDQPQTHQTSLFRKLLIPFTFGMVYQNRVYNEYLKENGLFHRIFAFEYDELQRLIKDFIDNGVYVNMRRLTEKDLKWNQCKYFLQHYLGDGGQIRYAFKSSIKIANVHIVFENEDGNVMNDEHGNMHKVNVNNFMHLISVYIYLLNNWCDEMMECVSFNKSINPKYVGLKINGKLSNGNDIQSYAEYCLLNLCKGYKYMNMDGSNCNLNKEDNELLITGYLNNTACDLLVPYEIFKIVKGYFPKGWLFWQMVFPEPTMMKLFHTYFSSDVAVNIDFC